MRESIGAFRNVFANPGLRRLQLAWIGSNVSAWSYGIVIAVYAFREDGAYAVGLLAFARFVVAGIAAPLTGVLGDRLPRVRVMLAADLIRIVVLVAIAALVAAGSPSLVVYGLSIVGTIVGTAFRPAQAALVPSLARTPEELTASNVAASTTESIGIFAGPALGGVLVAAFGVEPALLVSAGLLGWSAVLLALIHEPARERREAAEPEGLLSEALGGFRILLAERRLALLGGLFAVQTFVDGALGVLTVVIAFELLAVGSPESWVGFLNSAAGVGGILGAVAVAAVVARGRLAANFAAGLFLWGAPLVLVALWVDPVVALVALALTGVANTVVDVMGDTLLQRAVPDEVLARTFGAIEGITLASVALGAVVAPLLLDLLGVRGALVAVGALLPVAAVLSWRALTAIDAAVTAPQRELELLAPLPFLSPLPPQTLELLAHRSSFRRVGEGETVFRRGERGDSFFVVAAGAVTVEPEEGAPRTLGPADFFGEIALLREVPRTATVTAREETELLELPGEDFVAAVAGHTEAFGMADSVVAARLAPA